MSSAIRKSVFSFLVIALLLPGVYVAFQPREEARAFDVNQAVWNYVINPILTAVASAGYVYIKERLKFMSQNFVKEQFRNLVSGDKGKDPLLQEESLESFNRRVGQKASGAFMEGFAGAVENAVERDAKKARLADEMASARAELEKLTPAQIRDILRKQGVADDKLSTLSDDQLKDIYLKSLEKTFANAKAPSSAQGSGTAQPVPAGGAAAQTFATDPSTLTPAQIRELVLQTGQVTKEQIDEVDDATLRTMFLQAVQKAQAEQSIKGN